MEGERYDMLSDKADSLEAVDEWALSSCAEFFGDNDIT